MSLLWIFTLFRYNRWLSDTDASDVQARQALDQFGHVMFLFLTGNAVQDDVLSALARKLLNKVGLCLSDDCATKLDTQVTILLYGGIGDVMGTGQLDDSSSAMVHRTNAVPVSTVYRT